MRVEAIGSVGSFYPVSPPQRVRKKKKVEAPRKGEFLQLLMEMTEKRKEEEAQWRELHKPIILSRDEFVKEKLEMLNVSQKKFDYLLMCKSMRQNNMQPPCSPKIRRRCYT